MTDERWVFDAADAMADAGGLKGFEGFPDAGWACGFSGVGGAVEAVVLCVLEGGDVGGDGKAGFVSGDVEGCDAGALELMDEVRRLQALRFSEVAEGTEDEAGFYAGVADALFGGTVDGGDYGFRG